MNVDEAIAEVEYERDVVGRKSCGMPHWPASVGYALVDEVKRLRDELSFEVDCMSAAARNGKTLSDERKRLHTELDRVTKQRDDAEAQLRSAIEQGKRDGEHYEALRTAADSLCTWAQNALEYIGPDCGSGDAAKLTAEQLASAERECSEVLYPTESKRREDDCGSMGGER